MAQINRHLGIEVAYGLSLVYAFGFFAIARWGFDFDLVVALSTAGGALLYGIFNKSNRIEKARSVLGDKVAEVTNRISAEVRRDPQARM